MITNVIPSRITEARESRAMSMEDLAERIHVTRQSVSKYERGIVCPSPETLQTISFSLDFPIEFFYKPEADSNAKASPLFFRSNSTALKKVKLACKYQIKWVNEIKRQLEEYVDLIECDVPTIDKEYETLTPEDIEELALEVRDKWGLSDKPIGDLIGILENRGIIVTRFATSKFCPFNKIDAFSSWKDGTPYILYHPEQKSAVRTRFSICHELGHLIMHSAITDSDSIRKDIVDLADEQADRFAAAFLLPATSFPNDIHGTSILALESIKAKWGAALSTMIRRCKTLELLTDNQVDYLQRQMSTNRYWRKEPLDDKLTIQQPELLRDAIKLIVDEQVISKKTFFEECAMSQRDVQTICELPDDFFDDFTYRKKPVLRLVTP